MYNDISVDIGKEKCCFNIVTQFKPRLMISFEQLVNAF